MRILKQEKINNPDRNQTLLGALITELKSPSSSLPNIVGALLGIYLLKLNEVCKEVVKTTAKSFIDSYVILEAKRMLVSTSFSVKEIAFTLGFDEATNFLKCFKKHTSLTPVEFRNTLA